MQTTHDQIADKIPLPAEHLDARLVVCWLVAGSALVGTAIVAFGWKRTVQVWAISGVALALVFVLERLWYKYVRKSQ